MSRPWTAAEDARLLELRGKGVIHKHIAVAIGRTRNACNTRYCLLANGTTYKKPSAVSSVVFGVRLCIGPICCRQVSFKPEHRWNFLCKRCTLAIG